MDYSRLYTMDYIQWTHISVSKFGEVSVPDVMNMRPFEHAYTSFINL